MSIGLLFWIIMVVWAVFGTIHRWVTQVPIFVLLFLLGWKVFGFIIHE
jgi:hypothetical protein